MSVYTDLFCDVGPLGRILSQLIKEAILDTFYSIFLVVFYLCLRRLLRVAGNSFGSLSAKGENRLAPFVKVRNAKTTNILDYHSKKVFLSFHWPRAHHVTCK